MELILNELSVAGQFASKYEFAEYVETVLMPLLNDLETDDLLAIIDAVPRLIEDLGQGRKSNLWDKLQEDIFEFRMRVSSNRVFRLLFVQYDGIQFLNGFVKKTQQTPEREITKAVEIKKKIKR